MPLLEPKVDLELDEGEYTIHVTRRHWIVLLQRGFIFFLAFLITAGLAFFRAIGGQLFVSGVALRGQFDVLNIILLGMTALLVVLWLQGRNPKRKGLVSLRDLTYLITIGVFGLAFLFRLEGGRLFHIDPFSSPGLDLLGVSLTLSAITTGAILLYQVLDWANDFLVLTNFRVIHMDTQLLVRDVKQEIVIDNIRQIDNRADSYIAYWLGYLRRSFERLGAWMGLRNSPQGQIAAVFSTLVVRSFSVRTLTFGYAWNGYVMERLILEELNKLRRQQEPELLRRLIEDRVYSDKPPPKPSPAIHVEERPGPIPWFFSSNPEIKGDTITWRPYWIFLALAMLRPLALLVVVSVGTVLVLRLGFLTPGLAFVLWLPIALFCIGWVIWIREEHENDKYILNRQNIIDVDKKPFGPESSRRGPLSAVQDIVFDVNFIESILGYGDVIIDTGGGGKFTFRHVPDPRGVQATINDYLTDFKKGERERQLNDMLMLLKQYHIVQDGHGELFKKDELAALIDEKVAAQLVQPQAVEAQTQQVRTAVRGELIRALRLRRLGRRRL
jgi:hypothetical protein